MGEVWPPFATTTHPSNHNDDEEQPPMARSPAVSWWLYVQTQGGTLGYERVAYAIPVRGSTAYVSLVEAVFTGKVRPEFDYTARCDADLTALGYVPITEQKAHILCDRFVEGLRAVRGGGE